MGQVWAQKKQQQKLYGDLSCTKYAHFKVVEIVRVIQIGSNRSRHTFREHKGPNMAWPKHSMGESKDDGIAYKDLLYWINHQKQRFSTWSPSGQRTNPQPDDSHLDQSNQRLNDQIDDHQHRHLYVPCGPGKLSERPCTYINPTLHRVRGHNSEPPCTRII